MAADRRALLSAKACLARGDRLLPGHGIDLVRLADDLAAEVDELRRENQQLRKLFRLACAVLARGVAHHEQPPTAHWRVAFRLGRAGLRLDSKRRHDGWVTAWYRHPAAQGCGATIDCPAREVGR